MSNREKSPVSGYAPVQLPDTAADPICIDVSAEITGEMRDTAEQCLADNGIDPDEAWAVLQALGYILLDIELYPGT